VETFVHPLLDRLGGYRDLGIVWRLAVLEYLKKLFLHLSINTSNLSVFIISVFTLYYIILNKSASAVGTTTDSAGTIAANREAVGVYRRLAEENWRAFPPISP
jgi:hypothetical protein